MNISYQWLKNYLSLDCPAEELSQILTSIGLEIEGLECFESIKGGLKGLVIGKVLTCVPHPDSDHLHITTVDIGNDTILPIVCGAPNVAEGQHVIVATIGTVLYDGDKEFVIKKSKIRGEVSEGMICAEDEIGIGSSHDGIIVLDEDTVPGTPASEFYNIVSDDVFSIGLTPNRIDAASHYGVARDLRAYFSAHGKELSLNKPFMDNDIKYGNGNRIEVDVEDKDACPTYLGLTIRNVKVAPSPEWLQNSLKAIGMHPINNIVDISNYVLHELCQPLHIFDADAIKGNKVVVRSMPEGTPFVTLDGEQRKLSSEDLMICNTEEPMCIAGVFGGLASGVTDKTVNVFIESAYFNPVKVRKTARRHALNTDASFRFERGIDPNIQLVALKRAAQLVLDIAGGEVCGEPVIGSQCMVDPFDVVFNLDWFDQFVGKVIDKNTIRNILKALEIEIVKEDNADWYLKVPAYRVDVTRAADVAEEILRLYGYNAIEINNTVHSTLSYQSKPDKGRVIDLVSNFLSDRGFNEAMNNSLTQSAYYEKSQQFPLADAVSLCNPLSAELSVMRQTLLFGGLENIEHNINHKIPNLKLYEFGYTYRKVEEKENQPLKGYAEKQELALWMTGIEEESNWITQSSAASFFSIKSYVEAILNRLGIFTDNLLTDFISDETFSEGLSWAQGNRLLAEAGLVNKGLAASLGVKIPVYYAHFNWDMVMLAVKNNSVKVKELPKYPDVKRDLALVIDQNVSFSQIKKIATKTERKLLRKVSLFDVYQGDKIPDGKKSYAVSFILRDDEKTLQDSQIENVMSKLLHAFEKELGAVLR